MSEKTTAATEKRGFKYYWSKFQALNGSSVFLAMLAALVIFEVILQISKGGAGGLVFVTPSNLMMIFRQMVYTGIIAFGLTLVMLTGNIDLSVGNMLTFTCCIAATVMMKTDNAALTVLATLGVGLLCGLFNGLLVTRFNLSSIVITIGTMSLYRGITYILLGDQALNHYPESFAWFGQGYVWGALSFECALFILLAAAFTFLLHKTNFGRRTYAIGNNPTGAWFSGINVKRHNLVLFALVGLMAGLAAVLLTSRLGSTRPTLAMGWELAVVTMAVLGGVNILGGSGSMPGVIIAAFLMGLVTFGLSLLNVPGIVMSVIIGAMLIVVISLPIITRRMMQRRRC